MVSEVFTEVANRLGLNKNITDRRQQAVFYTFRHTFASWMAMKSVPRYTHLCLDTNREAIRNIDLMYSHAV